MSHFETKINRCTHYMFSINTGLGADVSLTHYALIIITGLGADVSLTHYTLSINTGLGADVSLLIILQRIWHHP